MVVVEAAVRDERRLAAERLADEVAVPAAELVEPAAAVEQEVTTGVDMLVGTAAAGDPSRPVRIADVEDAAEVAVLAAAVDAERLPTMEPRASNFRP